MAEATTGEPEPFRWRDDTSTCFGCSPRNPRGLALEFFAVGAGVECRLTPGEDLNGAPGIVHGGIQATILDEAMGYACHVGDDDLDVVTVEMQLRYRRPVRVGTPIVARAEVVSNDGRDLRVEGTLRDEQGEILTLATARFRLLSPEARSGP